MRGEARLCEIFPMKHRLLQHLVRDRYAATGEGDPRQALRDMHFRTGQTEEAVALFDCSSHRSTEAARGLF
jgi:hypothetical protein